MQIFLFLFCQEERNWVCVLSLILCTKHCKQAQIEITLSIWADDDDECTMWSLFMICIQKILLVIFFFICNLPIINWEVNQKNATLHICSQLHCNAFCVFIYNATTSSYMTWVNKYECMLRCCCDPSPTLKSVPFSLLWSLCFQSL